MTYKLLTFNEDFADEINVPALAVMTDKEYDRWLKSPSGSLNPTYIEEKEAQDLSDEKSKLFWKMLEEKGYVLNGSANISTVPKSDKVTHALIQEHYNEPRRYDSPIKVHSEIYGYLGNFGDNFSEEYSHMHLMKEFVDNGYVDIMDVSKDFYDTFNRANLSSLSLCNVFEM